MTPALYLKGISTGDFGEGLAAILGEKAAGFLQLLTNLLGKKFTVENPFVCKTKTDVVGVIKRAGLSELILSSSSCGHVRTTDTRNTHCGVCSQCIERRLAMTIAAFFNSLLGNRAKLLPTISSRYFYRVFHKTPVFFGGERNSSFF
ncbi:MAG: 7-cyano-7-deazaguanine synthase [candidate division Zixibacteria bacterium]|nr:7-cyano-7-deazaguanine synthase [candidate division Zixibacteria bacterium]